MKTEHAYAAASRHGRLPDPGAYRCDTLTDMEPLVLARHGRRAGIAVPSEAHAVVCALLPPGTVVVNGDAERTWALVQQGGGWAVVDDSGSAELVPGDLVERTGDLLGDVELWWAEVAPRRVHIHAGVVGWNGRAILLPGRSLAGKSSLTAALLECGASYYSDEYAVLRPDGWVLPYARPLSIRSAVQLRGDHISASDLDAKVGRRAIRVGLVAHLQFQAGEAWSAKSLTPSGMALALIDNAVPARRRPKAVMNATAAVAGVAAGVGGIRGEAADAAPRLLALLDNAS